MLLFLQLGLIGVQVLMYDSLALFVLLLFFFLSSKYHISVRLCRYMKDNEYCIQMIIDQAEIHYSVN